MSIDREYTHQGVVVQDFATAAEAETAIRALIDAGFTGDQISVAARNEDAAREVAGRTDTEAAEGAVTGAVAGGILVGIGALIAGASAIAIPGLGIAIGGPIAAAIAGAAGGGLAGALIGLGIPENEAQYYEERFEAGHILVSVAAGEREQDARDILTSIGIADAEVEGLYGMAEGSTGNTILDQGIVTNTAGVTPSIDTVIGEEEGEGYEPIDDTNGDERPDRDDNARV